MAEGNSSDFNRNHYKGNSNGVWKEIQIRGGGSNFGGGVTAPENSAVLRAKRTFRHDPGMSLNWTDEEQEILDNFLARYVSESNVVRYARIAQLVNDKTVRDIAARCIWLKKKENRKRRKDEQHLSRKTKHKKERRSDPSPKSSQVINRSNGSPYVSSMPSMDNHKEISYQSIGGVVGQLLEQNDQDLNQISTNIATLKIHENINLFHRARTNLQRILTNCIEVPDVMKGMPQLPDKLNDELLANISIEVPDVMKGMPQLPEKLNDELLANISHHENIKINFSGPL